MFFCLSVWKERSSIVLNDGIVVVQRLKCSFVYMLWSWNRSYLGDEVAPLIGFLEWLNSN